MVSVGIVESHSHRAESKVRRGFSRTGSTQLTATGPGYSVAWVAVKLG
jgi:hypothetical protein